MDEKKNAVSMVIELIEDHMECKLKLEEIAKRAGYSKFHLNRIFYEQTGRSIYQYIRDRRLTEAARKLETTDAAITDIALEACYSSQQAFTQAFKQFYGCPPKQYRKERTFVPKCQVFRPESRRVEEMSKTLFSGGCRSVMGRCAA